MNGGKISLIKNNDNSNQCYKSPSEAKQKGADLFIIGRAIYTAIDPLQEIIRYHKAIMEV